MTTLFAGMLMPSESVSVANTTFTSPSWKSSSTVSLNSGSIPAWWAATPVVRDSRKSEKPRLDEIVLVDPGGARLGSVPDRRPLPPSS